MKIDTTKFISLIFSGLLVASCSTQKNTPKPTIPQKPKNEVVKPAKPVAEDDSQSEIKVALPSVNREFRAVWVATVANINWPSKGNYSTELQKQEAINILDQLKEANFNAVIFQARPSADALYKSNLEPWSYFLTGQNGKAPSPFYDPLEFWISEAHKRGLELHVWLNPYRAHHSSGGEIASTSMVNKMPEQIIRLKNGMYWMDPSDDKTQNHVSAVIKDMVKRYDIDAIHIDDYFYPYREYNGGKDFPDSRSWNDYVNAGGSLSKADWRRANVNKFIKRIHDEIKAEKPYVKFGISPFGIWKPGYPSDIKGSSQYDELFADAKLWLNEGWCDYFSPQLYWKDGGAQSFSSLLRWWEEENYKKIHLWPGLNTIGIRNVSDKPSEIVNQIEISRNINKNQAGQIHYSVDGLTKDWSMMNAVKKAYAEKALVPVSPWIKATPLAKPNFTIQNNGSVVIAKWNSPNKEQVFHWLLFAKYGDVWNTEILDKEVVNFTIPTNKFGKKLNAVAVKAVDRLGNESNYSAKAVK